MSTRAPSPLDRPAQAKPRAFWLSGSLAAVVHGLLLVGAVVAPAASRAPESRPPAVVTQMFEVELDEPEPPAEPEPPEPEAEREPEPPPPAPVRPVARREPPPAPVAPAPPPKAEPPAPAAPPPEAAAAAKTLTAEPAPAAPADTLVQGEAASAAGGVTQAGGTSQSAVRDTKARAHGVPGGTGDAPPGVDRSRPAGLAGGDRWQCPFPREAELNGIVEAKVTLALQFTPDGGVASIGVQDDPGEGFGREARRCALRKKWRPPLDRAGKPRPGKALIRVRFTR